jgi:hypothetical protein
MAALAFGSMARAGELDRFLPADTEIYLTINIKQAFSSGLAKKLGADKLKDVLKEIGEAADILKDLGFDPFKDLDTITVAGPGSTEADKGLVIVHGTFDLDKFKAKGEDAAKNFSDNLKIHKVGDHILYEAIVPPSDMAWFVALPSKDTMLLSPGKDYVVDALKKTDAKAKAAVKNKEVRSLLEKMSDKQTIAFAALGSALLKDGLGDTPAKDVLEKLDALAGGLTITDDLKIEVHLSAKNADDAAEIEKSVDEGVRSALTIVGLLAGSEKKLNIVLDLLKSVKTKRDDKTLTIKGLLDADAIDKALKKDV